MTTGPYRSRQLALTSQRDVLVAELEETQRLLCCARSPRERLRMTQRLRRLGVALAVVDVTLGNVAAPPAPSSPRAGLSFLLTLGAIALAGILLWSAAAERRSTPPAPTFDPNAIDGADTVPRIELDG